MLYGSFYLYINFIVIESSYYHHYYKYISSLWTEKVSESQ